MTSKITVDIKELDRDLLKKACFELIDVLEKYPIEIKIGALHQLLESLPVSYEIMVMDKPNGGIKNDENSML